MPMTLKRREKLVGLGRYALAILGGGAMLCYGSFLQLVGLIRGEVFLLLVILFGILIGMMASELPSAIVSGFLAFFVGTLMFFGFILLPVGGAVSWQLAEVLVYFAIDSVIRVIVLSFFAIVLIGPVVGRIIGPDWYQVRIQKHTLKVPLPEKEAG
jgi:hypothetical protein